MRPIRDRDPAKIRLVTLRTEQAALWMIPFAPVNEIIGGVVARYQEIFGIEIFAYVFLSNHKHLLVRAPYRNLDEFEENVNREIARRINKLNGRQGRFWAKRYSDQECVRDDGVLEALTYVASNPVRHGLVEDPDEWPGLNFIEHLDRGPKRWFTFTHYSKLIVRNLRELDTAKVFGRYVRTKHAITLSKLPQFEHLPFEEYAKEIRVRVQLRVSDLVSIRRMNGKGFMGRDKILRQRVGSIPKEISKSPRPICYSKDRATIIEFRAIYSQRRRQYDASSRRYRSGDLDVLFPENTFKPPLHRRPRDGPFKEITLAAA